MIMNVDELNKISERIINAAYRVSNTLGVGFLEKVYENALAHQLRKDGMGIEQQKSIKVYYDNVVVGDYFADLIVLFPIDDVCFSRLVKRGIQQDSFNNVLDFFHFGNGP